MDITLQIIAILGSLIGVLASFIIILKFLLDPIREQVYNHIPTQIKELKDEIKRLDQKFEEVNQTFEQVNQKLEQVNQRFEQVNQKFDQVNQRLDRMTEQINQRFDKIFDILLSQHTGPKGKE